MPPAGFEPTFSEGERPQTYAFDCAATGTDNSRLQRDEISHHEFITEFDRTQLHFSIPLRLVTTVCWVIVYFRPCFVPRGNLSTQKSLTIYLCAFNAHSLTHCGRVTQICVFNTVKLGTSASSPQCHSTRGNVSRGVTPSSTTRVFVEYFLKISVHKKRQRICYKFLKKHSIKVD